MDGDGLAGFFQPLKGQAQFVGRSRLHGAFGQAHEHPAHLVVGFRPAQRFHQGHHRHRGAAKSEESRLVLVG